MFVYHNYNINYDTKRYFKLEKFWHHMSKEKNKVKSLTEDSLLVVERKSVHKKHMLQFHLSKLFLTNSKVEV